MIEKVGIFQSNCSGWSFLVSSCGGGGLRSFCLSYSSIAGCPSFFVKQMLALLCLQKNHKEHIHKFLLTPGQFNIGNDCIFRQLWSVLFQSAIKHGTCRWSVSSKCSAALALYALPPSTFWINSWTSSECGWKTVRWICWWIFVLKSSLDAVIPA